MECIYILVCLRALSCWSTLSQHNRTPRQSGTRHKECLKKTAGNLIQMRRNLAEPTPKKHRNLNSRGGRVLGRTWVVKMWGKNATRDMHDDVYCCSYSYCYPTENPPIHKGRDVARGPRGFTWELEQTRARTIMLYLSMLHKRHE